ncbi:Fe-S cluster assembly protein SufD [Cellvibrio sp. ARAG 10.3]|uniref:Fe-S cluster assembly protein SufD n=1 Tax=Cellvibrio sp. ARAG 10.3 TaxID=3451358 RepID=UPI003F468449
MTDFQQDAVRLAAQQQSPDWLASLRQQAAEDWLQASWPTRKTEHWKYTPLLPLQKDGFKHWAKATSDWQSAVEFIDLDATRLVFVNGVFDAANSSALPEGVVRFCDATDSARALIQQHLGKVVDGDRHLFATLSNAWAADGVLVHVPRNQALEKPVYIVHVSTPGVEPAIANQRVLVVLEESARAEIIEHYLSTDAVQNSFVNSLSEMVVGDNAELQHYRLNLEEENLLHLGGVHVNLLRNARLRAFTLAQGSRLKRIDYQVNHRGAGADLNLQGIYLPRNNQVVDYHTNVQHCVPHCTTNEIFRGIIADSAHAVFNGRIHIFPDAQKTLAELSNKNLLTSNKAEVDTKPELEIYADDVKCAHGATVSQLNATALYYLQSRGVSRQEAEVMMSFGFINELLQDIAEPAVQDYLLPRLARLFGRDGEFLQRLHHE